MKQEFTVYLDSPATKEEMLTYCFDALVAHKGSLHPTDPASKTKVVHIGYRHTKKELSPIDVAIVQLIVEYNYTKDLIFNDEFTAHEDVIERQIKMLIKLSDNHNPLTEWACNVDSCNYSYFGQFMGLSHLPDTDCPVCKAHDSVLEVP